MLCGLLVAAFLVRAWLIPHRWVGPDEGAHLMDGWLLLDGLTPDVDFGSRQVLYAHLTGLAVWLLGTDLFHLRYFPLVVTLLAGTVLHLIGRRLFGWRAGLVAAGLFLLLPFSSLLTIQTKTEPLAILSTAGAVYCMVRSRSGVSRAARFLFLSGICAGAAFYIRQSTIAVVPALLIALALEERGAWKETLRSSTVLLLGIASFTVLVGSYYLRFIPLQEILSGHFPNPATFLVDNLQGALDAIAGPAAAMSSNSFELADRLSLERSLANFSVAARTCLVLGVGGLFSVILLAVRWRERQLGDRLWRYAVPMLWLACLALAYGYWTAKRGFYPAYFLEWTAPLALLTGATVAACWRNLPGERPGGTHLLALLVLAAVLAVIHWASGMRQISRPLYFILPATVLAAFYVRGVPATAAGERARSWTMVLLGIALLGGTAVLVGPSLPGPWSVPLYLVVVIGIFGLLVVVDETMWTERRRRGLAFAGYTLLVSSLFVSLSESAVRLEPRFHSVWSPETLRQAAGFVEAHTDRQERVMSGAVIWEFQADRPPFANVSHPLSIKAGTTESEVRRLRSELRSAPPHVVVVDGYTEQTYFPVLPELRELLRTDFEHAATISGSRYPVEIYVRSRSIGSPATTAEGDT